MLARVSVLCALTWGAMGANSAHADRALARALVEEGAQLEREGKDKRALERYEQAIEQDADYLPAYDRAAWLWMSVESFDTAIDHLERVTLRHPEYGLGWYALGFAYRKTNKFDLAVACYDTYISMHPEEADPYYGLAMAHKGAGHMTKSSVALQRYLTLESRSDRASFIERARRELEAMGVEPPPVGATATGDRLARAGELIRDQRFASAQVIMSSIVAQTRHERGVLWLLRARAYLGAGDSQPAVAASLIALANAPEKSETYDALAEAFNEVGAKAVAEYFLTLKPAAAPEY